MKRDRAVVTLMRNVITNIRILTQVGLNFTYIILYYFTHISKTISTTDLGTSKDFTYKLQRLKVLDFFEDFQD